MPAWVRPVSSAAGASAIASELAALWHSRAGRVRAGLPEERPHPPRHGRARRALDRPCAPPPPAARSRRARRPVRRLLAGRRCTSSGSWWWRRSPHRSGFSTSPTSTGSSSSCASCGTWALVDGFAGTVVAAMARRDPAVLRVLDRWVTDDDFWVRRSAVLALRGPLAAGHEWERFVRYADALLDERVVLHPQGDRLGGSRGGSPAPRRRAAPLIAPATAAP